MKEVFLSEYYFAMGKEGCGVGKYQVAGKLCIKDWKNQGLCPIKSSVASVIF